MIVIAMRLPKYSSFREDSLSVQILIMQEVGYFPLGNTFNGKFQKTIDKAGLGKVHYHCFGYVI